MSRNPPRYIKLQDFPAHNGNVNCIKIGTKSSGVLVTGGDDKKVNLWTIGAQTKALSLQGHSTPVESVTFDHNEEVVAAGAASGSIKIFDLDQAKVTRAMSGHRSNVLCLELSQYGLLSGSMDTNVKVWDLRGRDVIATLKGHKAAVKHVKFSPDGKWVASASEDGQVKIWDLVGNKLLADIQGHTHSVTGLHFHPVEYLLGTCSADKTVKVWDLETFALVEQTPVEATGIRAMAFHPDGRHVLAAVQDALKVWSWEPAPFTQHDSVELPWFKVADISVLTDKNKLVGCSYSQNFIGLWVVDLKDVRPFGGRTSGPPGGAQYPQSSGGGRVDMAVARSDSSGLPHSSGIGSYPQGQGGARAQSRERDSDISASTGNVPLPGRSPSLGNVSASAAAPQQQQNVPRGQNLSGDPSGTTAVIPSNGPRAHSRGREGRGPIDPPIVVLAPAINRQRSVGASGDVGRYNGGMDVEPQAPTSRQPAPSASAAASKGHMVSIGCGVGDSLMRGQVEPGQLLALANQGDGNGLARVKSGGGGGHSPLRGEDSSAKYLVGRGDVDLLADVSGQHEQVKSALAFRLSNVQLSRSFMQRGDVRGALAAVRRCGDGSVGSDLIQGMLARHEPVVTLDFIPDIVPVLEQILCLSSEKQVQAGIEMATMLYRSFHQIIRDTCSQVARVGVDLSFEQRREKCMTARISLQGLGPKLGHVAHRLKGSHLSYKAQDLAGDLATL